MGVFIDGCSGGNSRYKIIEKEVYAYQPYVVVNEFEANVQFRDLDVEFSVERIKETSARIQMLSESYKRATSLYYFYKNIVAKYDDGKLEDISAELNNIVELFGLSVYHFVMANGFSLDENRDLKNILNLIKGNEDFIERIVDSSNFKNLQRYIGLHLYLITNVDRAKSKIKKFTFERFHNSLNMVDFGRFDEDFKNSFFNQALEQFKHDYL